QGFPARAHPLKKCPNVKTCAAKEATGGEKTCQPVKSRDHDPHRDAIKRVALVAAMDARVVVGAPAAEETPVAVATRGVATPSPVPLAPSTAVTVTGTGNSGGGGGGGGSSTAAATLASAPCTPQNPVIVVASPSSNHQQPTGVPVTAVPRILSRNVNGTLLDDNLDPVLANDTGPAILASDDPLADKILTVSQSFCQ
ncbi:hypothetical protein ALC56_02708, partial [Trachymyrmex septentrionalis]